MKKLITLTLLLAIPDCIYSIITTNKTFMSVPTANSYVPVKYTTWHRILKQGSSSESPWHGTLQVAPFYKRSNNCGKLGKYFGTNFKNVLNVSSVGSDTDIQNDLIIHDITTTLTGKLKLEPRQTDYGAIISYNQELNNIHDGLFLRINLPVQHIEHDLHATVTDERKIVLSGSCKGILDYFSGNYVNLNNPNKQDKLTSAKISCIDTHTGIADLELILGYKLADKKEHQLTGALKLLLPTGNRPSGEFLFPAIVGNNRHWGFGAYLDSSMNVVKGENYCLECLLYVDFIYLFKSDEKRTLGFRNGQLRTQGIEDTPVHMPWAHYLLGGENGKMGTFPLANILTRDVSVTPGGKVEGHASFAYHKNNTTFDFGYSFFGQEGEKVSVKCWPNDTYGIAHPDYPTNVAFDVTNDLYVVGGPIQKDKLNLETATTPAIVKHSVHGALGYTLSEWNNPLMMGVGVSFDWTQDNTTPTGYTIWAKVGATF